MRLLPLIQLRTVPSEEGPTRYDNCFNHLARENRGITIFHDDVLDFALIDRHAGGDYKRLEIDRKTKTPRSMNPSLIQSPNKYILHLF